MNKLDAYIKNFERTKTPSKKIQPDSKDQLKSKSKTIDKKNDPKENPSKNIMNSKIQEQSRLMKANYKILMEERKNPKEEARLTRSATKKNVEEVPEAKEQKKPEAKSNIKSVRSKTVDNTRGTSNKKNFTSNYLTKPSYILKKRLQFK